MRKVMIAALCSVLFISYCMLSPACAATNEDPLAGVKNGDLIYYGIPNDDIHFDGAWRVLDSERTNTGEPGMFLLSENLIGSGKENGIFFLDEKDPPDNAYQGSDAQKWCNAFYETAFSQAEKDAMIATYKSDAAYTRKHIFDFNIPFFSSKDGGGIQATVNFDAAEHILNGDKLFPLSAEEADSSSYGFVDNVSRIAGLDGIATNWWLRSPHDPSFPIDVGIVFFNGWLLDFFENQDNVFGTGPICMRPAFNLDRSRVVAAEKVGDGEWVLVLEGENPNVSSRPQYQFGARGEIQQINVSSGLVWLLVGFVVIIVVVTAGLALLIVLTVRRVKRSKKMRS